MTGGDRVNGLARLLAWDGLLLAVVWAIPAVITMVLPDSELLCLTLSILLPIEPLLVRFNVGQAILEEHHCPLWFRKLQWVCLCIGLSILMCLDSLLIGILSLDLPANPEGELGALTVIFVMFDVPYLVLLSVAMSPGNDYHKGPREDQLSSIGQATLSL